MAILIAEQLSISNQGNLSSAWTDKNNNAHQTRQPAPTERFYDWFSQLLQSTVTRKAGILPQAAWPELLQTWTWMSQTLELFLCCSQQHLFHPGHIQLSQQQHWLQQQQMTSCQTRNLLHRHALHPSLLMQTVMGQQHSDSLHYCSACALRGPERKQH